MYLEEISITRIQPCTADSKRIRFKARFSRNVSDLFPYINGFLKDAIYNPRVPSLTFKKEFRIITLHKDKLAVSKAINETDAYEITDMVRELVNDVYKNKGSIIPFHEMRKKPTAIELYKYLPQLNCKRCDEATCLAFASKFLMGESRIKKCQPLYEENNKNKLEKIEEFVQILGYE